MHPGGHAGPGGLKLLQPVDHEPDGPPGLQRQEGRDVGNVVLAQLSAEGPSDKRLNHPNLGRGNPHGLGQELAREVDALRRRVDDEPSAAVHLGHRAHGLDIGLELMRALVDRLVNGRRFPEAPVHVSPLDMDVPRQVARPIFVDQRGALREGLLGVEYGRQGLILHVDEGQGLRRRVLVRGGDRRHFFAHVANPVFCENVVLFVNRTPRETGRVAEGDGRLDALDRTSAGKVDPFDPGMGVRVSQNLAVEHPGSLDVVNVEGLARHLLPAVHLGQGLADDCVLGHGTSGFSWWNCQDSASLPPTARDFNHRPAPPARAVQSRTETHRRKKASDRAQVETRTRARTPSG